MNRTKLIGISLAILLFICLAPMPYGYFQFVRFASMITFAYFAYVELKRGREFLGITFIGLAILFQPIFKIALGRELWNVVDVIVGIGLFVYLFSSSKNVNKETKD